LEVDGTLRYASVGVWKGGDAFGLVGMEANDDDNIGDDDETTADDASVGATTDGGKCLKVSLTQNKSDADGDDNDDINGG